MFKILCFQCSGDKESTCNIGDTREVCLIPGLERSPGERNGNPFQYSCLEVPWTGNLVGYSPWGQSWT